MIAEERFIHLLPPKIQVIVRRYTPNTVEHAVKISTHFVEVLKADRAQGRRRGGSEWFDD